MKTVLSALFLISVGIATSYAGGFSLLKIGSADGNGGVVGTCTGVITTADGCPLPMLGM